MEKQQSTLGMVVTQSGHCLLKLVVWVLGKSDFSQLQNKVLSKIHFCSSLSSNPKSVVVVKTV